MNALLDDMQEASARLEEFLATFLHQNAERYAYGALFEPIYHDLAEYLLRRGKRLRPRLLLASYRLCGGTRPWSDPSLLRAAATMEFFHSFILIHDDVIDRADLRRGRPALHKGMGKNLAIVAGDLLHTLALDTLLDTDFPFALREAALRRFLHYATDTGGGEALDILLSAQDISQVSPEEIERMYYLKTTRYTFEAPLVLGAILAGADAAACEALAEMAEPMGLAFQIDNDLDVYALQADVQEGKKTLLLRTAYERLGEVDRSFLQLCLDTPTPAHGTRGAALHKIRELVEKSGAVPVLKRRQEELLVRAQQGSPGSYGLIVELARQILRG